MQLLPLLLWAMLPGCGAVWGPGYVSGFQGGTLSVTCTYDWDDKTKPKFWCRPGLLRTCNSDLVVTKENKPMVRRGRFSIHDNHEELRFTVTVANLTKKDKDFYYCGVRTASWQWDKVAAVEVTVYPAPSTTSSCISTTQHLGPTSSVSFPTQTSTKENSAEIDSTSPHEEDCNPTRLSMVEYILIPGIAVVVLLLAVAAGVLLVLSRKRKKALPGAAVEMDGISSESHTGGDTLTYVDVNHRAGTAESSLYGNAEAFRRPSSTTTEYAQVKLQSKCLEEEEEVTYASVRKSLPEQQEIYANVPAAPQPPEELYSTVQRV